MRVCDAMLMCISVRLNRSAYLVSIEEVRIHSYSMETWLTALKDLA